jgi:eukaryotic-like serine/threonine-protein kinase
VQSLRAHVRSVEPGTLRAQLGPSASELAQILPELRELFPDLEPVSSPEAESARFRLFDAVASLLRRISEGSPLVLGLDDLHAADEPSLLLLQFVARELDASRILIVAAYRDVDPTPPDPLTATITDLLRQPLTSRDSALRPLARGRRSARPSGRA